MSAIAGIWNRNQKPVAPEEISAMMAALADFGKDGNGIWHQGAVFLGHQMLHTTPESLQERLPCNSALHNLTITADARIDNRTELAGKLGLSAVELADASDSELILRSFVKWDCRCVEHLLGDFSFVIWDETARRAVCVTDHFGLRPFFYYCDSNRFAFATKAKAILSLDGINSSLNRTYLAGIGTAHLNLEDRETTCFNGIKRVPPATVLTVTAAKTEQQVYWEPSSGRLSAKSDQEIFAELQELIISAVAARLRSAFPVGVLFSGGLDSSAVLAAALQSGKALTAFSSVSEADQPYGPEDDRHFIELFRGRQNLDLALIKAEGAGPLDNFEKLIRNAEVPFVSTRHYTESALYAAAQGKGVRVLLSGIGGEFGVTNHASGVLAEWFVKGRWHTLAAELSAMSAVEKIPLRKLLAGKVIKPLLPVSVVGAIKKRLSPQNEFSPFEAVFQPSFTREQQKSNPFKSVQRPLFPLADHLADLTQAAKILQGLWPQNHGLGIEQISLTHPLADKRVIEFCLSIPSELHLRNGYRRYLVRGSMNGLLPPEIQWRTNKDAFSPDYPMRLFRQLPGIIQWLDAIQQNDPVDEIVNLPRLKTDSRDVFAAGLAGIRNSTSVHSIPLGLYLISFLRQFPEFSPTRI